MLSIVVPVFNEIDTVARVMVAVAGALPGVAKEIILVDDGSTDGTREWIQTHIPGGCRLVSHIEIGPGLNLVCRLQSGSAPITLRTFHHERTLGKGASLRTGLAKVTGEVVVVQDADLEYDPQDWTRMYDLIVHQKLAQVVYGSRFRGRREGRAQFISFPQAAGNWLISSLFGLLYRQRLSDVEVCYKMFTRQVSDTLDITCPGFGCEIQVSAQITRDPRWKLLEVGVSYRGRSRAHGKKISWRDGFKALWYVVRFRVGNSGFSCNPQRADRFGTIKPRTWADATTSAGATTQSLRADNVIPTSEMR